MKRRLLSGIVATALLSACSGGGGGSTATESVVPNTVAASTAPATTAPSAAPNVAASPSTTAAPSATPAATVAPTNPPIAGFPDVTGAQTINSLSSTLAISPSGRGTFTLYTALQTSPAITVSYTATANVPASITQPNINGVVIATFAITPQGAGTLQSLVTKFTQSLNGGYLMYKAAILPANGSWITAPLWEAIQYNGGTPTVSLQVPNMPLTFQANETFYVVIYGSDF